MTTTKPECQLPNKPHLRRPPPPPPKHPLFSAVPACFKAVSMRAFCLQLGGLPPPPPSSPTPPLSGAVQVCFTAYKSFLKPIMRALCLQMGRAGLPPNPPLRFLSPSGLLQSICVFLNPIMRAFCLQMGLFQAVQAGFKVFKPIKRSLCLLPPPATPAPCSWKHRKIEVIHIVKIQVFPK